MDFSTTFSMQTPDPSIPHITTTIHPPENMGNVARIAYGGFALGVAAKSSALSVPPNYRLYSLVGQYLGPASTDRPLKSTIRTIRQTRTFATRLVEVSQTTDKGDERLCLVALADFQVPEPASLLQYSVKPTRAYTHHSKLLSGPQQRQQAVNEGKISQGMKEAFETTFGVMTRLWDLKPCPEGIFAQNLNSLLKSAPTTQDSLPTTEKSTADWYRLHSPVPDNNHPENMAALAFLMDGAMGFVALGFEKLSIADSGAASSLDFALRVFGNEVRMDEWHLKELITHVGDVGRTYSEARLWDEEGRCVAALTEQCILRPKVDVGKGKL